MINQLTYYLSDSVNPYHNLGLEEYLLLHVKESECILYLWQNQNTVVIGRNQNSWKECKIDDLEQNDGFLCRRLSGGGAVYHDLGNLNFTFLVRTENYNLDKQLQVIIEAVKKLGITAQKTGRNDITVDGKKFSGNAFYEKGNLSYHHGTIMVNVDVSKLSRYLNVSKDKLEMKGVASVKSRVANLSDFKKDITIAELKEKLIEAFGEVYEGMPGMLNETLFNKEEIASLEQKYDSWEWKYGRKIAFEYEFNKRFLWGDVGFCFHVDKGLIKACEVYSDSMNPFIFGKIKESLIGCRYNKNDIHEIISKIQVSDENESTIILDMEALINEKI